MKGKSRPQQVIDGLAQWWIKSGEVECKLGREPPRRRMDACSVCPPRPDFEINWEIARLMSLRTFKRPGICPYRVVASRLVAAITLGPEASRSRSLGRLRVDPIVEIRRARRCIRTVLGSAPSRDNIEVIASCNDGARWQALYAVMIAERALERALTLFKSGVPVQGNRLPKGRAGALHNQAVTHAMALAWRQLTGRLPGKDNRTFHELAWAAISGIFGYADREPNLESATRIAVERIRKDAANGS